MFRTRDEGMNWERISPDLSLNDRKRQGASGGPITRESAGAEVHATCACVVRIAASPRRDLGLDRRRPGPCHARRRQELEGRHAQGLAASWPMSAAWKSRRTTPTRSTWRRRATSSPTTGRTCSRAPTAARAGSRSTATCPKDEISRVVRADAVAKGLLYVGTETGIHFSLDDGATWTRMSGLPNVPVYDMKLKDSDLVAATHGRSFWILDDVTALRGLADGRRAHAPVRAAPGDPHQAALERRRQRAHRHRLRSRLRHRRQHGDGRAGRRHALSRASRCRREPAQRRHRLLLAVGEGHRTGNAHLP